MSSEPLFIATALAQESSPAGAAKTPGGTLQMFLPMILVFGIFYLLMIRPQQKQRKQHQTLLTTLKKGDEVVTAAGIHGKVAGVTDTVITLEIADNVRVKLEKQQVATVKPAVSA